MSDPPARKVGDRSLAVIGTGQLARAVCYSLAVTHPQPLLVTVVGRRMVAAAEICQVASARAAATGRVGVKFEPGVAEEPGALTNLVGELSADGVLVCASTQSPWERLSAPSAWTTLVERAGFGLTLPFQAALALAAGAALTGAAPPAGAYQTGAAPPAAGAARELGAWLVNACFPDAVNAVLVARGVPVLCGVGNVGSVAAGLQAALGVADPGRLHVLGHHVHLHQPASAEDEALAWCDGEPVAEVGKLLAAQRATTRPELNHVTGLTATLVLTALLTGAELRTSVPGPYGLPGGYPVLVGGGRVALRLPPGLTEAEAVARNQRWALADGVVVDGQRVRFPEEAHAELATVAPDLAGGFELADLDAVTRRLHELRERLRGEPPR